MPVKGTMSATLATKGGRGMVAPEEWIGRRVVIQIEGLSEDLIGGELLEVSDRGLVLSRIVEGPHPAPVFFPWRVVRFVQHDTRDDQAPQDDEEDADPGS
jgi:hypothetical protein